MREATATRSKAAQERSKVRAAAATVAGLEAERVAIRHAKLAAEQSRIVASLARADIPMTQAGTRLPAATVTVLLGHRGMLGRAGGDAEWTAAIETLCSGADAEVTISLPSLERAAVDNSLPPPTRMPQCVFTVPTPLPDD